MDRYWFLSWTCYGRWLPGDRRGFVGNALDPDGTRVSHNTPGTPYAADRPRLAGWAHDHLRGEPVSLGPADAAAVLGQLHETARVRGWTMEAAAVMENHVHVVVGVGGDPDPDRLLTTFKSWATRAVTAARGAPPGSRVWTRDGSKRKVRDAEALQAAVVYVARKQPDPLVTWAAPEWETLLAEWDAARRADAPDA